MQNIKIYTTTTCPFCKMEKAYLDEKKIEYENVFCDQDPAAVDELMAQSGQYGVPFTVITKDDNSTEKILGFDKERLNQVLGIA